MIEIDTESQAVTLALGGGGVKCYTQIGVLKVLERAGVRLRGIAGTSAGGIVAALYAAGYSPTEIQQFHESLNLRQLLKRRRGEGPGLFGLQQAKEAFRRLLADRTFADLDIPLALTSVDLNTGLAHPILEGSVLDALMIAVAIPGLFPPTPRGGQILLDGGILHPVPVAAARALAPECPVVAVALFPPYEDWDQHPLPNLLKSLPFFRYFSRLPAVKAFGLYVRAMDISQRMLAELRLEVDRPEVLIRPEVHHLGLFDLVNIPAVVQMGEAATEKSLIQYQQKMASGSQMRHYPLSQVPYSISKHVP